jgi:phage baseplate assembly protein V
MALSQNELDQISKLIANRLRNMFARGEVKKITKGKTTKAKVEFLSGEIFDGIEMPQQFGHQSHPPVGSEVIALFLGGNRDHGSIIATFNKSHTQQEELEEGETAMFDRSGSKVVIKADGSISITPSGGTVQINGNLVVTQDISDQKGSMQEIRDIYNSHTHDGGSAPDNEMT